MNPLDLLNLHFNKLEHLETRVTSGTVREQCNVTAQIYSGKPAITTSLSHPSVTDGNVEMETHREARKLAFICGRSRSGGGEAYHVRSYGNPNGRDTRGIVFTFKFAFFPCYQGDRPCSEILGSFRG